MLMILNASRKYLPYLTVTPSKKIFNAFLLGVFNGTYISIRQNASYSDSAANFPPFTLTIYIINSSPIQAINCHRDLGILMSSDLKWSNHLMFISSRANKILGLIRRSFSSGLHISAKKNLYITLIRSQLTYASQIWRPHLIKDILAL